MILANVRSLKGLKMDELRGNAIFFTEYRDACLMAFTETKFDSSVFDQGNVIEGFGCPTRLDATRKRPERREVGVSACM